MGSSIGYLLFCLFCVTFPFLFDARQRDFWNENAIYDELLVIDDNFVPVEEIDASSISHDEFIDVYWGKKPVIIRKLENRTTFKELVQKWRILRDHGDLKVILASANANSYEKRISSVKMYIKTMMKPQTLQNNANESWYLFGDNSFPEIWFVLLNLFDLFNFFF